MNSWPSESLPALEYLLRQIDTDPVTFAKLGVWLHWYSSAEALLDEIVAAGKANEGHINRATDIIHALGSLRPNHPELPQFPHRSVAGSGNSRVVSIGGNRE